MRIARGKARDLIIPVQLADGSVYDLTGTRVRVVVKAQVGDIAELIVKDTDVGVTDIELEGGGGTIRAHFVGADTVGWTSGTYWYDAQEQDPDTLEWYTLTDPRQFEVFRAVGEV